MQHMKSLPSIETHRQQQGKETNCVGTTTQPMTMTRTRRPRRTTSTKPVMAYDGFETGEDGINEEASSGSSWESGRKSTATGSRQGIRLSPFVAKLNRIAFGNVDKAIAHWDQNGTIMIVEDDDRFLALMGASKLTSVIRQLHFFAFKKCSVSSNDRTVLNRAKAWGFANEMYRKDCPDLIYHIKRYQRAVDKKNDRLEDLSFLAAETTAVRESRMLERIRDLESEVRDLKHALVTCQNPMTTTAAAATAAAAPLTKRVRSGMATTTVMPSSTFSSTPIHDIGAQSTSSAHSTLTIVPSPPPESVPLIKSNQVGMLVPIDETFGDLHFYEQEQDQEDGEY